MKEIFIARKAFEACLISSALLVLVTMMGAGMEVRSGCGMASAAFVVAAVGQRGIDFAQDVGGALAVAADRRCGRGKGNR